MYENDDARHQDAEKKTNLEQPAKASQPDQLDMQSAAQAQVGLLRLLARAVAEDPCPNSGQIRHDHGVPHVVSGKWCGRTVLDISRNSAILGRQEFGHRSEGKHRRLSAEGHRVLTATDKSASGRAKLIHNPASVVISAKTGAESLYDESKWNEIQSVNEVRGRSQRGVPRTKDLGKYPLACSVIDMTDGCGSIMYGRTSGKRRLYTCGRYMRTVGAECEHNQVDAEALLAMTLCTLSRYTPSSDANWERIKSLLYERARKGEISPVRRLIPNREDSLLRRVRLTRDLQICGRRMVIEEDEHRHLFFAAEFDRIRKELAEVDEEIARLGPVQVISTSPDDDVAAALRLLTELRRVIDDPAGRPLLPTMFKHLGVRVGLNFRGMAKGPKREVRRLAGGLLTFGGFELPVPLHGRDRVAPVECDACLMNAAWSQAPMQIRPSEARKDLRKVMFHRTKALLGHNVVTRRAFRTQRLVGAT